MCAAKGSTSEAGARKYIPNVHTVTFEDTPSIFLALQQGKVDGVVISELTLVAWQKDAEKSPVPIDVLHPALFSEPWGIGMRKDETALIAKVNETLAGMEKSGEAAKIFDKWFGKGTKQIAINRLAAAKDGSFYMGTIETIGNWPPGTPAQPIYHVVPKDNPASFDMKAVRSLADGIELEFTEAVDPATATIGNIPVIQWTYVRQEGYGQGKSPTENRTVSAVEVSDDKKRVHLKIAGLKDNYVTYFKLGAVKSASGAALWNNEAWFTLNKISTRTWNSATVAIAAGPKAASALAGLVRTRLASAGLQVTLDAPGRAEATLRSLSGAALRAGSGEGEITLATEGLSKGVYLLDVRLGAEKTVRAVSIGN